jgi:Xaa-Pro aminopeptidase
MTTTAAPLRDRSLAARRAAVAASSSAAIVVAAGLPIAVAGTDAWHRYRGHDHHRHLAGEVAPARVLVHGPGDGWSLFVPRPGSEDAVWHGSAPRLEDIAAATGVAVVRPLTDLAEVLAAAPAVALCGDLDILERPGGYDLHPEQVAAWPIDADATAAVEGALVDSRLVKDGWALAALRRAIAASVAGHEAARAAVQPGLSERRLAQVVEHAFDLAGGEGVAYPSIVLTGRRAATLHGAPGAVALASGDLVLIDAGAEVEGYDADLTRTLAVGAGLPAQARAIHDVVRRAQEATVAAVAPGVEVRALHDLASRRLAEGLLELGLLRGSVDDLLAEEAQTLFFPHGIGHFLGLATHDVGGYAPGRRRSTQPSLRYLRADRRLEPGMVLTIEPGLYFIDALLDDPEQRRRHAAQVDFTQVERYRGVGGVRIEDDVLVTSDGCENLSRDLPRDLGG